MITLMTITEWIPALTSSSLLLIAGWLFRSLIITRLKSSVGHEFNIKLNTVQAEIRQRENELDSLKSGALTALANRQSMLAQRRILAVDQLWAAVQALGPAKSLSASMAVIKFENALKTSSTNSKAREFFSVLRGKFTAEDIHTGEAEKARPYISDISWAIFSAYRAITSVAVIKAETLKSGLDMPDVIDKKKVDELITAVLPHQAGFIAKFGHEGYHYLLDELESRLLAELRNVLNGTIADAMSVSHAAEIMKLSKELLKNDDASK